jgi:hypothetical protein
LNYLSEFHQKLDNKNFFFSATFGGKSKKELQTQIDALREGSMDESDGTAPLSDQQPTQV